ncbi:Thiol-disulfide isomerase or thioredoxin [Polaromonas sp. OV174]|uniref:TlpA disulfide reductase family protein n=1 Tax=Polaromonas sp. OV174 TaxID=1855300 RepID=UPI0008DEBB1E|nr:TlpA disulfide reductase family protein [Polaromonas sp. OV174]SFB67518.1 Thiol-disulfide isomerase or thioredoxin [Polaromonas sp. OV174]
MNRRHVLYGGVAAAAGLAGAGAAWWKFQPHDLATGAGGAAEASRLIEAFWALNFDTPDGKSLPMSSFRGKWLLVNFWATWCPPCVEELPLLDYFYQENKSKDLQIVGLAVDQPSAVRTWLETRPLNFPVGMAGLGGTDLSKSLGNQSGALPFSVVFGASGQLLHRKIGQVHPEDLVLWSKQG